MKIELVQTYQHDFPDDCDLTVAMVDVKNYLKSSRLVISSEGTPFIVEDASFEDVKPSEEIPQILIPANQSKTFLDFFGKWITKDGYPAFVISNEVVGDRIEWHGSYIFKGKEFECIWDEEGRNQSSALDLTDRVREAKI